MKWRCLKALALLPVTLAPALAHETDHFTVPTGRTFADMGRELTARACRYLERAVERTNERIADARSKSVDGDESAELQSADTIAAAVMHEFPGVLNYIETLNRFSLAPQTQCRYPGQIIGWLPVPCIYDGAYLPLDFRQFYLIWRAPLLMIDGVYVGTDKLGHLVHIGHDYFRAYRAALRQGRSEEQALAAAIQVGVDANFLLAEEGLRGGFTSGVLSNADLAANYLGLLFYRNLTEPVLLRGRSQPPLLEQRDGFWQLSDHVRADSEFFTQFFDHHLDEALNPNLYDPVMSHTVAAAIRARASALRAWYRDANGCPRPRSWFLRRLEELRTYYGMDYGHMTGPGTAIGLVSVCFRDVETETDPVAELHAAADDGDVDAVRNLLDDGTPVDGEIGAATSALDRGVTPLHRAAAAGRLSVAQLLLDRGAAVDARSEPGVTALHRAAEHAPLIKLLLDHDATADVADEQGRTPLHWAARAGATESVVALLEAGADAAATDVDRRTPLHDAADAGAVAVGRILLDHGADPDAAARYGWRPLHGVVTRGDTAMANVLLSHGADGSAADAFGCTPLQVASRGPHGELVELLRAAGTPPSLEGTAGAKRARSRAARRRDAGPPVLAGDRGSVK